mmetsp:Transcript_29372/g.25962  ORF Transcript_29372/g.25962 Transcript_29372/m.25962 type:complete len:188 (+) Transcript_29372:322-885(+)
MVAAFWVGMFYWHWVVTSKFYQSDNDCRKSNLWLWFAHLTLLIEAFISFLLCCCLSCGVLCFIGFICLKKKDEREKKHANLKIKDLLLNAAAFRINPNSYEAFDDCPICIMPFEKDQNIICLPCNPGHVFHDNCIGEWVKINNNCPLCKAEITKEAIEGVELGSIPFIRNDIERQSEGYINPDGGIP